ncbi:amidase signature domain-containing protein, partial [Mycena filopes]
MYRLSATQFLSSGAKVEDYAQALLSRIAARDIDVQAWAYLDPEYVLSQARTLDAIPLERRGPLHGVPIGVKDIFNTMEMPTRHNSPIYSTTDDPGRDAALITMLRSAGALIFGKTTTTEFASITVGTKTMNPHNPARTPGGSSSGSGAAVGDFQVPLALGTQTLGSIMRPASFNGIFGFKPTWGSISHDGIHASALNLDTAGFFARSVADLELLADAARLQDDEEPPAPFKIEGAKFAVCQTHLWSVAGPGTRNAMDSAVRLLRDGGALVEVLDLPGEFSSAFQHDAATTFMSEYIRSKDQLDPALVALVEKPGRISHREHLAALDNLAQLRPKIDLIATRFDAIITPSAVDEAPEGLASTGNPVLCGMWT